MSRRPDHLGKRVDFSAHTKKLARERAGHVCQYPGCDASAHEVDHIIPQRKDPWGKSLREKMKVER